MHQIPHHDVPKSLAELFVNKITYRTERMCQKTHTLLLFKTVAEHCDKEYKKSRYQLSGVRLPNYIIRIMIYASLYELCHEAPCSLVEVY
jgi:uncharacterized protein YjaZ